MRNRPLAKAPFPPTDLACALLRLAWYSFVLEQRLQNIEGKRSCCGGLIPSLCTVHLFFFQSRYPCPCPRGENREDRQGRGMVPTRGRLRRSPSPWFSVSSRERSLRPHSRTWKKTTGGHGGTNMPGSPKPHSQNLQHDGFRCWPNKSEGIPSYILFIGRLCSCLLVIPGISYFWCVNFVLHSETTSDLYPVAACGKERCFQYSGYGWKAILPYRGE